MKKTKYIVLALCLLILSACTSSSIKRADSYVEKHSYLSALEVLEQQMKSKQTVDQNLANKYRQIYQEAEEYYNSVRQQQYSGNQKEALLATEKTHMLQMRYFSLPQSLKKQISIASFDPAKMNQSRADIVKAYTAFGDQLSSDSYQNRLQKYLAYEKALYYSETGNTSLQQKANAASLNLEKNLDIGVQGSGDFVLQNLMKNQLQASLSSEKFFQIAPPGNANIFLRVQIQNYQFLDTPESFSTKTEYINEKVPVTKVENGKVISKMETQKIPYQKIYYTQKQILRYHVVYSLYDKNQNLVVSGTLPVNIENNKAWTQSIPLDIRATFNLPQSETKPNAMSKEQMQEKSVAQVLKAIRAKIKTLK